MVEIDGISRGGHTTTQRLRTTQTLGDGMVRSASHSAARLLHPQSLAQNFFRREIYVRVHTKLLLVLKNTVLEQIVHNIAATGYYKKKKGSSHRGRSSSWQHTGNELAFALPAASSID